MSGNQILIPQKADFHMHTTFCDGKNTAEEMVLKGIALGLEVMGFSVHSPHPMKFGWCISHDKTEAYRAEIHRLRDQYADKIRIYCGIEQDYHSGLPEEGYDYVIGSVHVVTHNETAHTDVDHSANVAWNGINTYFDGDPYAYAEAYYALVADVVRQTNADLIGHFDLITKFQDRGLAFDPENPRYVKAWQSAVDQLLQTGKPFEINTGAISRGYRKTPYPALDIMKYLAQHGGTAVITSDSHSTEALGTAFTLAYELAKEAGLPLVRKVGNIEF